MNAKKFTVIGLAAIVALFFYMGMNAYQKRVQNAQEVQVKAEQTRLVRMHSPVFGPQAAPVTIVEFFDPACETCRAFYPIVKDLMAQYPNDVRLVIRYAPFHQGSDQVVKLLEASKSQGRRLLRKKNRKQRPERNCWTQKLNRSRPASLQLARATFHRRRRNNWQRSTLAHRCSSTLS